MKTMTCDNDDDDNDDEGDDSGDGKDAEGHDDDDSDADSTVYNYDGDGGSDNVQLKDPPSPPSCPHRNGNSRGRVVAQAKVLKENYGYFLEPHSNNVDQLTVIYVDGQ